MVRSRRGAALAAQARSGPLPYLLGVSLLVYTVLVFAPVGGQVAAICGQLNLSALWVLLTAVPWTWGLWPLAVDWSLMIVAMMTPLVSVQVARLIWSSRPGRAPFAVGTFLAAYWMTWCAAAVVLIPLAIAITAVLGSGLALWLLGVAALAYSASPLAGHARNLCHRSDPIPAFGPGIVIESARAGFRMGGACCLACWPWMLIPLAVQTGHFLVMVCVGLYLFAERIAAPAPSAWRVPPGLETILGPRRISARLRTSTPADMFGRPKI
ncbi:MAG: DUF2182 domain-containing protein [Pseudomonadota bacterium]